MSNDPNAGGDISSGFGESEVNGPVSDEKAEQMLHGDRENSDSDGGAAKDDYAEQDVANNEQDLTQDG